MSTSRSKRDIDVPGTHGAVIYTVDVGVGSPPTQYTLIADTGSSNTWIGANKAYVATSARTETADTFSISYGSGSVSGQEYIDQVNLGGALTIEKQSIGGAKQSKGFDEVDGILGLGPVDLTTGTLSPDSGATIPTVADNAFSSGLIPSNIFGIYIPHSNNPNPVAGGEISLGGEDNSKFTGQITFVPITANSPANTFWGIDATFAYGSTALGTTAGIVDTGTTLLLLAHDWLSKITAVTGATEDKASGLLHVPASTVPKLETLTITVGGTPFTLTPEQYTVPPSYYSAIGINADSTDAYFWFHSIGTNFGEGIDFILGLKFLEHYYSVYDATNSRVGLATAIAP
ncbi:hypothetical protein BGX26_000994 [Mortierella sp. AD094]|nr:hypothetical protein BGX26_000994 [Mortierella sp. AD094]